MTARPLLIMLPGAYFQPGDYAAHGFVRALRLHAPSVDAEPVDLPAEHYLDGTVAGWLHEHVVLPTRGRGRQRIWLLGTSMGAMGALIYAQAQPAMIEGLVLLSPFLGTRGLIAEATACGGLAQWEPGAIDPSDRERRLLAGLKDRLPPRLHLGCGTADRFAASARLLARQLPDHRVTLIAGDHDWPTWTRLWSAILARAPFDDIAEDYRCATPIGTHG